MDKEEYFGYHCLVNVSGCDPDSFDKGNIEAFVKELVKRIDMKAYGEPSIEHFATHNPKAGGYSLMQLIETSCITAHFVDADGSAFFDCFSCKFFDKLDFIDVIDEFFAPKTLKELFLIRGATEIFF
jgi:S-adenosylmethionine/arginine decarboxylase-like enzyme